MSIGRRTFFGLLGFAGLLPAPLRAAKAKDGIGTIYRGYRVFWTGWKAAQNTDLLIGQWIAWPEDGKAESKKPCFYASAPGSSGPYFRGAVFDCSWQRSQEIVTLRTDAEIKERERAKALRTIIRLVDDWHQGKVRVPWLST